MHQIDRLRHQVHEPQLDAISRPAFDGDAFKGLFSDLAGDDLAPCGDRAMEGDGMTRGRLHRCQRDDAQLTKTARRTNQSADAGRMDAVVIGDQDTHDPIVAVTRSSARHGPHDPGDPKRPEKKERPQHRATAAPSHLHIGTSTSSGVCRTMHL